MGTGKHTNEAFATELAASQRRLLGYIMTLVPSFADAEDILQNTNARIVSKADEFDKVDNFAAWACRFAQFEVLNFRKRQARDRHIFYADEALLDTLASEAQQRYFESDAVISALEYCEEKLASDDRKLLSQRYREGCTIRQLSTQTGRGEAALRQALYKIRRALLKCIKRQLNSSQ